MKKFNEQLLNKNDVRKGTLYFLISFFFLCTFSFLCVLFFFKSADLQRSEIDKNLDDYRMLLSKNDLLLNKIDTIYFKMSLLSKNKVENENFLKSSLIRDIRDCKVIIGEDSLKGLSQYSRFIKNLGKIIEFKSDIMEIHHQEQAIARDLSDCTGNVNVLNKAISKIHQ